MNRKSEIPAADMIALLLLGLLATGWFFAANVQAADALAVAAITTLLFWAPLRLMDYLHHGRVRGNDVLLLLRLDLPRRAVRRPLPAGQAIEH